MSKEIKKYDKNNNLIYGKWHSVEYWYEHNEKGNIIHFKNSNNEEYWQEFDENNNLIHYKGLNEHWFKYGENNEKTEITKKEYNDIEFRKKEKEYNSRTKCSRFEIMDI